jgi:putative toxin-antitoxin system antitoxin component (TIGR02293 family)
MIKTSTKARTREKAPRPGIVNKYVHGGTARNAKGVVESLNAAKVIESIQKGLPFSELDDLRASLDVDIGTLASILGISRATLHRRKTQGRLDAAESDRVLRYARLIGQAATVFGGIQAAREWLRRPQFGLGGAVPLDYAQTEPGAREVENLLGRIEYGVYS